VDYSIIIPSYNEETFLPQTIQSVQTCIGQFPHLQGEIIVVDNNSSDRTAEVAGLLGCKVISEPVNQISRARNAGGRAARGKYLFFLDADTLLPANTFMEAYQSLSRGEAGAGGAMLRFDADHRRLIAGILLPKLWNLFSRTFGYFAGCFVFCRKDLFISCGGFPETHYAGEEILFRKRIKKQCSETGFKLMVLDRHHVTSSARKLLWYGDLSMIKLLLPTLLLPFVLQNKKFCRFWYDRPN